MLDRNLLFSMARNLEELAKLNEQLSTGQRVNTVSDDVLAAGEAMRLQRENEQLAAYLENTGAVDGMLSVATSTLQKVSETLTRVKELAIQAGTETYTATEREIMAEGVDQLLETLISLANVENKGAYLFSGESVHTAPYVATTDVNGEVQSVAYQGEVINTEVPVGPGTSSDLNLVGQRIFQDDGDLFETVIAVRDALRADDTDEINRLIGELEVSHTDTRRSLGRLGERQARLDVMASSLEQFSELNAGIVSERLDADVAELSVKYNSMLALLQTVMKVAAQGSMPSVADFL
jgi:flagellar hook-associated protein 3 FlgL